MRMVSRFLKGGGLLFMQEYKIRLKWLGLKESGRSRVSTGGPSQGEP